jgi:methylglyoxal synthase
MAGFCFNLILKEFSMNNVKKIERIAVVADDDKRTSLIEWSYFNRYTLSRYRIIADESTADLLKGTLIVPVTALASDSAGGYREVAKLVQKNEIDILIYFGSLYKDDIPQSGMMDLLALAHDQNIVTASNPATANLVIQALQAEIHLPDETGPYIPRDNTGQFDGDKYYSMEYRGNFLAGAQVLIHPRLI